MKIEAVMIVKNEEKCLGRCLESLAGIDKITILDTGSTDKTGEIARKCGANFIENVYEWEDHFANARNSAMEFATGDWILIIDADETLVPGSLDAIREAITAHPDAMVFKFRCISASGGNEHIVVRCHRRHPDIYWKGAAHNYLTIQEGPLIDAKIIYGHSPAHDLDPDRTLRILSAEVAKFPDKPRETFYLAREYYQRRKWDDAIKWYSRYIEISNWAPEKADAHMMLARCYIAVNKFDPAWFETFSALRINADLREGLQMLAALSGPLNRKKWLEYSALANNSLALFIRNDLDLEEVIERDADYYREVFSSSTDMSRYEDVYRYAGSLCRGKVLDMGCGLGEMLKHMPAGAVYKGFDFAGVAEGGCFEVGDIYEYPLDGYDTYLILEVLEHVDDIGVLSRIPAGGRVVFSVPSFPDPAHLRTYTVDIATERFSPLIEITGGKRFDMQDGKWIAADPAKAPDHNYIMLFEGVKK